MIANRLSRPPITVEFIRKRIEEQTPRREKVSKSVDLPLSQGCKRVLAYAAEEAERLSDKHIGPNHLLLALIREKDGLAAKVLSEVVTNLDVFREEIGRMSDASWNVAHTPEIKREDFIEIHGELWTANTIRQLSERLQKFHWEKRRWVPRDGLVQRADRKLHFYSGQSYDPEKFELVKGEWSEDRCAICWWGLCESDSLEHGEGFTNGQDWLCTECYERFLNPNQPAD